MCVYIVEKGTFGGSFFPHREKYISIIFEYTGSYSKYSFNVRFRSLILHVDVISITCVKRILRKKKSTE